VTKFIAIIATILVTLCRAAQVRLRCSTNSPQGPEADLMNASSSLAAAVGATKAIAMTVMNPSHFVV